MTNHHPITIITIRLFLLVLLLLNVFTSQYFILQSSVNDSKVMLYFPSSFLSPLNIVFNRYLSN
ncbi:hypothetical protein BDB01DRAFT_811370 [Pilobolus umbonatus]|nr:hypothetical protein BDB01DRAFT_811370 [Pilobolus umbonatus]